MCNYSNKALQISRSLCVPTPGPAQRSQWQAQRPAAPHVQVPPQYLRMLPTESLLLLRELPLLLQARLQTLGHWGLAPHQQAPLWGP